MKLYTIGFTQKRAEQFFGLLGSHGVQCLIDVRLRPNSQLSGFANGRDLPFFLGRLNDCRYMHVPQLAPTDTMLATYREHGDWSWYAEQFEQLMEERNVPHILDRTLFETAACCLLCSEATADRCHRRLVAERLVRSWSDFDIVHL